MGNATNCVGCGAPVVSCVLPAYCPACDPHYRQALQETPAPPMTEDLKLQLLKSIEESQEGLRRYVALPDTSTHTNPDEYQRLSARTECDQTRSVARMAGLLMHATKDYTEPRLAMIRFNHGALGVCKEGGELLSLVEKWIYYGQELDKNRVVDELGDVMHYAAMICNAVGISLSEVMAANLRKLAVRYPEKYDDQRALVRDRAAEAEAVKGPGERSDHTRTYSDPDFVPPPPCPHCRGAGQVSCEWEPCVFTTCPSCNGTGLGQ